MSFTFIKTKIEGLTIIQPRVFGDSRGFFMESYQKDEFRENGIDVDFVQDNHSFSGKGVLRGLHFQSAPWAQAKLVRVALGACWDVAVDLRPQSSTYKEWVGVELTEENHQMFFIPAGFAHGFLSLKDNTHFQYKCSNNYAPDYDGGIRWNDPEIGVKWPISKGLEPIISDKDLVQPFLKEIL